ncbi:cytochrome c4 [Marinibactrum halimedae]|nr:c-type cytochrome [Marinibactrum halimedae]MCD9460919.1 cytochrome c4 [Marinibactrum halimedae]
MIALSFVAATPLLAGQASAAGNPEAGKDKVAVCAGCHGADGNSPAPIYPKLAGLGEKYIHKQLVDVQSGARVIPEMTGLLNNLSDQDLQDIAAFFASQSMQLTGSKELNVLVNSGAQVDALALGKRVYRGGNKETNVPACMGCHSPTGIGNAPAGYPRLGGQYAEYIEKQLLAFRGGERTNDGDRSTMRGVAKNLSDAEITAVANYIAGLN